MTPDIQTILKSIFFTLILLNIKSFPLAYNIRIIPMYVKCFKLTYFDNKEGTKKDLFQTTELKHTVLFDDLDVNMHMNNSSYNKLLDLSRGDVFATLFARQMWNREWNIMVKSVITVFNHEIPPLARYSIHTRILTWDHKWIFLISYFRLHSDNKITSLGLSRCIVKKPNGKTVIPEGLFESSGYFENESEEEKEERENRRQKGLKIVEGIYPIEQLFDENYVGNLNFDKKKDKNNMIPAKL